MLVSERRVCRVLGQHRSTQRKVPCGADDEAALTAEDACRYIEAYRSAIEAIGDASAGAFRFSMSSRR